MKKIGQNGFTLVEGLLVVITLCLITGVGFYVVNANKKDDNNQSNKTDQSHQDTQQAKKDYLDIKELGIKLDKSALPTTYYKISESERERAYPSVPELKYVVLYDSVYDDLTNTYGEKCGDMDSSLVIVQFMKVADRDKKYSQYKNAELGLSDEVPTVVSDKYANKTGEYLYDYYKAQGVQAPINCLPDGPNEDFAALRTKNDYVQKKFDTSYAALEAIVKSLNQ